jgi:hypothetical protein
VNALRTLLALVVLGTSALLAIPYPAVAASFSTGVWTESAYTSVFKDSRPSADAGADIRLDAARNEFEGGQIVLRREEDFTISKVRFSSLSNGSAAIAGENLTYNFVTYKHLTENSIFDKQRTRQPVYPVLRKAPGDFPDPLSNEPSISVSAGTTQSIWVRAYIPKDVPGGLYKGTVMVETTKGEVRVPIEIDVRAITLPETQDSGFTTTLWPLLFGGLAHKEEYAEETIKQVYGLERYSDGWWTLMDNVAKVMKVA